MSAQAVAVGGALARACAVGLRGALAVGADTALVAVECSGARACAVLALGAVGIGTRQAPRLGDTAWHLDRSL